MRPSLLILPFLAAAVPLQLSGQAFAAGPPDIEVHRTDTGADIPNGGSLPLGTTTVGVPFTIYFAIGNEEGLDPLHITSITPPAGFTITQAPPSTIQSGASHGVNIRCNAATAGTFAGNVVVVSDDPDESPFQMQVSCTVNAVVEQPGMRLTAGLTTPIADGGSVTVEPGKGVLVYAHNDDGGDAPLVLGSPTSAPAGPNLYANWVVDGVVAAGGIPPYSLVRCITAQNAPITGSYVISISSNAPGALATYSFTLICGAPGPADTVSGDTVPGDTVPGDAAPDATVPGEGASSGPIVGSSGGSLPVTGSALTPWLAAGSLFLVAAGIGALRAPARRPQSHLVGRNVTR